MVKTGVSPSPTIDRKYGRWTLTKCKTCHLSLDRRTPVPCQLPLLKVALLKVLTSITSAKCDVVRLIADVGSDFILSPSLS